MRRDWLFVSILVFGLAARATLAADAAAEKAAPPAAQSWLALVDSEKYKESWDQAASFFKQAVTPAQWESAVKTASGPLGRVKSRQLQSAEYRRSLPGAPDGDYVVIQYATSFENKKSAVETITPMKDKDGVWRVSGYYIK